MKTTNNLSKVIQINKMLILWFLTFATLLSIFPSCSQKGKNYLDKSLNDTLSVTKLLVQEIRKDLESQADVDSINEHWSGKLCYIDYRIDKFIENSQSIYMKFGDFNGDSLNDAIATIEYYTGGNRPEFKKLAVERTSEGYQIVAELPLFGYRYVEVGSIKDGLLELTGRSWTNSDPMCCPSIVKNFKVKLVGKTFEIVNENSENINDQNTTEFEKAKMVADSIKQKYESEKRNLLRISYTVINEGVSSWTCYFDSFFKLNFLEKLKHYDENVETTAYEFYNPEGIILRYQIDQQGYNSNIIIWIKKQIYHKQFDTEKKAFNYSINEGEVAEPFIFKDQQVAHKLISTADNTQVQVEANLMKINKQEFTYDSDSSWYKLTVQKGEKGEFDSFWSELRIDSLMFVHLFGVK
jgi:hypothetical protein